MEIYFNNEEESVEIKDGLKTSYFFLNFLMILNLVSSVINLINTLKGNEKFSLMIPFWILIGIVSMYVLFYINFRKTSTAKIKFDEIDSLKSKRVFGYTKYSLKLKNGKLRDLPTIKPEEIQRIQETIDLKL